MIADVVILNLPKVPLTAKQLLPEYSGIYYVIDENNKVWYIGKANNIRQRWQGKAHHRRYQLEAQKKKNFNIYYEQVSESKLDDVEKQRIEKYHPHLNASPVKTKKVRPTETLLRETIVAIGDFAFIVGVEPPRTEIENKINLGWLAQKKLLGLRVIHICLDIDALKEKFKIESIEAETAIIKKAFSSRKAYASKWESFPPVYSFIYRLCVNGYVIEVNYWSRCCPKEEPEGLREYTHTTLAQESIRALTPESLFNLQHQLERGHWYDLYLKRLTPYRSDSIELFFDEIVDSESVNQDLDKISEDYKVGIRGVGSRSKLKPIGSGFISIDELLKNRKIELDKYRNGGVIKLSGSGDRIGLYVQSFNVDFTAKIPIKYFVSIEDLDSADVESNKKHPIYNSARGIINHQQTNAASWEFDLVYLLTSVDRKAWLLFEEYLKDFAKPATQLSIGEGFVEKFYVSPRKYIVPAKVNIKLENMAYSAWIPFGINKEFPTFEAAKEEIRNRLENSGLPGVKLEFKREAIVEK